MAEVKTETTIEKIDRLYKQIPLKLELHKRLAKEFHMEQVSIRTNWFSGGSVPASKRTKTLEIIEEMLNDEAEC